jgi:hypothetical protein
MLDISKKLMAIPGTIFSLLVAIQLTGLLTEDQLYLPRVISISLFCLGLAGWLLYKSAEVWGSTGYDFKIYKLKPNQIDLIIKLSKQLLPQTPSKKSVKQIYKANGQMIRIQFRTIEFLGWKFSKPTGFCSIMPMKDDARALLDREELAGISFTPEHIVKPAGDKSCIYIGSIAAKGLRAKRDIILYIKGVIDTEFESGVECIYTRPTSKEGLTLAKRFGFEPVSSDAKFDELERIYKLEKETFAD